MNEDNKLSKAISKIKVMGQNIKAQLLAPLFKKLKTHARQIIDKAKNYRNTNSDPGSKPNFKATVISYSQKITPFLEKTKELSKDLSKKLLNLNRDDLKKIEPEKIIRWIQDFGKKRGNQNTTIAITLFLCAYFTADLTALFLESFVPEPQKKLGSKVQVERKTRTADQLAIIIDRNLFNSLGRIPGEAGPSKGGDQNNEPVRSTLPFNLVGTVILRDELKSIATIEDKTASIVYPVRIDDEIPSKAKILKIESHKVIFLNKTSGQREYIDLPIDGIKPFKLESKGLTSTGKTGLPGVEKLSATQFNVSRAEVDKSLSNFNEVLTQARCVPNFENGVADGFKCFQIVPGSIYDKLGMINGDVLCGYNNQPIDLTKVAELINDLKTSSHIELCLKRDGQKRSNTYEIR